MNDEYSEIRIRNAYYGASLTNADCVEIRKRMAADNKSWRVRKKREENAGGFDPKEADRQREFARKKLRNNKEIRRDLLEFEIAQLKSAWASE